MSTVESKAKEERVKNPYVLAREEWNERYNDILIGKRNWRLIAVLNSVVAVVAVMGLIVVASKPKVVPYIVAVDKLGNVSSQGVATQAAAADDRLKRAALWAWMSDWRSVSTDMQVEKGAIGRVYDFIENGSPAAIRISDAFRKESPLELGQKESITVEVHSIYAASKNSYEVEWTETVFDPKGEQIGTQNYKGVLTIAINPPSDEAMARINPLGIYVTNASWSKIL